MKKGFTLIELLVVVLILGILASTALPQYKKAVWKARSAELQSLVRSLATAQDAYNMANGGWPSLFDELDLGFPLDNYSGDTFGLAATDIRQKDGKYVLWMNNRPEGDGWAASATGFLTGDYALSGFIIINHNTVNNIPEGELYCTDINPEGNGFCRQVMKGTLIGNIEGRPIYRF